jgi:glutathione S-transferase
VKLYGGPISPFVRKAGMCIIEKGLEQRVERVRAYTAMIQANVELMRRNPLSKIPVLETDQGTALFDSDVICEFLDTEFSSGLRLYPTAGAMRWQVLRWNALACGALDALVLWRFERNRPIALQSAEVLSTFATKLHACLDSIEAELPSISATDFSIAHISIACMFGYCDFRFQDLDWRTQHPLSVSWFEQFKQRPSARRTAPFEDAQYGAVAHAAGLELFWQAQ